VLIQQLGINKIGRTGYLSLYLAERVPEYTCPGITPLGIILGIPLKEHLVATLRPVNLFINIMSNCLMLKAVLFRLLSGWSLESLLLLLSVRENGKPNLRMQVLSYYTS
jgi:hypothetical protein